MHSAPSVTYPVGRSLFAAVFLLCGWLLGAATTTLWLTQAQAPGWRLGVCVSLSATAGLCAAWNWWRMPRGALAWDGESWSWSAQGQLDIGQLEVALDLQHGLLLRWTGSVASRWLWLERASLHERWDDLRRAVYSRARPPALLPAKTPAAKP